MSQYRLIKISRSGSCKVIKKSPNIEELNTLCREVMKISPGLDYGIIDDDGYFLWPDKYKKNAQYETRCS